MSLPVPPFSVPLSVALLLKMNSSLPAPPLRFVVWAFVIVNVSLFAPPMIVSMLATLFAALPLPVTVTVVLMLMASGNVTAWKSSVSLPSPEFSVMVSLPQPSLKAYTSSPAPPTSVSLPSPPLRVLLPASPMSESLPLPPDALSTLMNVPLDVSGSVSRQVHSDCRCARGVAQCVVAALAVERAASSRLR